tara:strand:- start:639 stop:968 length:330 start_codon:yes stop_codon:yes gene_type:complete
MNNKSSCTRRNSNDSTGSLEYSNFIRDSRSYSVDSRSYSIDSNENIYEEQKKEETRREEKNSSPLFIPLKKKSRVRDASLECITKSPSIESYLKILNQCSNIKIFNNKK